MFPCFSHATHRSAVLGRASRPLIRTRLFRDQAREQERRVSLIKMRTSCVEPLILGEGYFGYFIVK